MVEIKESFITEADCDLIVAEVKERESAWKFYKDIHVLGNSFYRHLISTNFDRDAAWKLYTETFDTDSFGQTLFATRLQEFYGVYNLRYMRGFSRPGYQIVTQETPRIWHYDDEKLRYPYEHAFPDYMRFDYFDDAFTFTLMLTDGDFTYEYYPQTYSKYKEEPEFYCKKHHGLLGDDCDCDLKDPITLSYKKGDLIIAKDRYLHRVGASAFAKDQRITLQGHGVRKNNILYIYW